MIPYTDITPVDGHIHMSLCKRMSRYCNVQQMFDILDNCGLEALNIQNITLWQARNLVRNPLSMLAKALRPANIFSFGGPRMPTPDRSKENMDYVGQVKELLEIGFDGIKLFGKPDMRHEFGEPFDSPLFDDMFAYLEETQTPTLFHVNDPLSFWDDDKIPDFAVKNGWCYSAPGYEPAEQLYAEIDTVMRRHPKLNILFPHVYFLSDDLPRLGEFLDRYEGVKTDLTPGIEMYDSFSANPEKTREFFLHYSKKIFFGTDNTGNAADQEGQDYIARSAGVIRSMREFLETEHTSSSWGVELNGISLPRDTVEDIYRGNFYRFAGTTPKPIDLSRAAAYAEERLFEARKRAGECPEVIPELEQTFNHLSDLALHK
jgi:hypothetical protein